MAVRAGDGHVSPRERVAGVLVLGNGEGRAMEILYGMAILATILVGRRGKLLVMRILVTIRTRRELHLVDGVLAGRRVAFVASNGRMFALQRIMRVCVFFYAKLRWLPAIDCVALRALSFARSRLELPFVRVGGMAI